MRLAVKATLLLLAVYVVSVIALVLVADRVLHDVAFATMREHAGALGRQIALAQNDRLVANLARGTRESRAELASALGALAAESAVVRSAALVDDGGPVLVAGEGPPPPPPYESPRQRFADGRDMFLVERDMAQLKGGDFVLDVPLLRGGRPVAYLRLTLVSEPMARLFSRARQLLVAGALLGLAAIAALAFLLQHQLRARERWLTARLRTALEGGPLDTVPEGELAEPLRLAEEAGRTMKTKREQYAHSGRLTALLEDEVGAGVVLAENGRVLAAGPRAAELLAGGAPPDEPRWSQVGELLGAFVAEAARSRHTIRDEILLEDGEATRAIRVTVRPVEQGVGVGIVLVRDPRRLEPTELDLRQAAQLRSLSRIYLGVAHDLRAPVNAMLLNLELLKRSLLADEDVDPVLLGRRQQWVQVIEEEIARLGRSLDVVLGQTAPPRPGPEPFDLRDAVSQVERLLGPQSRQQRVRMSVVLPSAPVLVYGERDALKQAIIHLAVNALEALPEKGLLGIELQQDGATARVVVSDTGPGIPEAVRARLFEKHVTTKTTGTGIGLYVARAAAEGSGGTVRLARTSPEGSVFELVLPVMATAPAG